jgi:iron complex outermembrane receptor protein
VRYDYHDVFGSEISSRAGVVYKLHHNLNLKLMYGSAYKAPSPELLYRTPYYEGDVVGNPRLLPEVVHDFECQLMYKVSSFAASTGLSYSLLLNKAEFVQIGLNPTAENVARIGSLYWETELRYSLRDLLVAYASADVSYIVRDLGLTGYQEDIFGWRGVIYPPYMVRGGILLRIPHLPMRISADTMYVAQRRSSDQNSLLNHGSYELPAYVMLNASISVVNLRLFAEHMSSVSLVGTNLANAKGPDPGFAGVDYPLTPLTVFLRYRQEL